MAAADYKQCSICELKHETSCAVSWCPECEDALCMGCQQHHSLSKSSRKHTVISIIDYQTLPPSVLDLKLFCEEHNEKYSRYCMNHEQPLCKKCMRNNNCKNIELLDDVIDNFKISVDMESVEDSIHNVIQNMQQIKQMHDETIKQIKQQRTCIQNDLSEVRVNLNAKVDILEEKLKTQLSAFEEIINEKAEEMEKRESQMHKMLSTVNKINNMASEFQTFLGVRDITRTIYQQKQYLQSIAGNKCLDEVIVTYQFDSRLKNLITEIPNFGEISIQRRPTEKSLIREKDKQSQIPATTTGVHLTLVRTFEIGNQSHSVWTKGCCSFLNGDIAFTDKSRSRIIIHSSGGVFKYDIPLQSFFDNGSNSIDVVAIDQNNVAVTSDKVKDSKDSVIKIIDITKKKVVKTIKIKGNSFGISNREGKLVCCVNDIGLKMVELNQYTVSDLYNADLPSYSYVTVVGNKLCFTNRVTDTVTLVDDARKVVWKFSDKQILRWPQGITADSHENIYVTGWNTHNVVMISADGKTSKEVLSKEDGMRYPCAIHYDKNTQQLIVVNERSRGPAFIYSCN